MVIASIHINTVLNHRGAKYLSWGYRAHPCLLLKQAKKPHPLPPKPLLAPKSGRFAKSSLTLNIHSSGEEKANSGKVQDWRQSEPHVRNSFLITGNALAHCIKMLWFIFIFSKVGLCFTVERQFECDRFRVLSCSSSFFSVQFLPFSFLTNWFFSSSSFSLHPSFFVVDHSHLLTETYIDSAGIYFSRCGQMCLDYFCWLAALIAAPVIPLSKNVQTFPWVGRMVLFSQQFLNWPDLTVAVITIIIIVVVVVACPSPNHIWGTLNIQLALAFVTFPPVIKLSSHSVIV